jgi:hypothetical protein
MKNTFKRLISSLLVLCILLLGTLIPANAYAYELGSSGIASSSSKIDISGHHNRTTINNYPGTENYGAQESSTFADAVKDGAIYTVGFAVGATAICYGADLLATAAFPPAAFLAPYCPVVGGGTVLVRGVQAIAK